MRIVLPILLISLGITAEAGAVSPSRAKDGLVYNLSAPKANRCGIRVTNRGQETCFQFSGDRGFVCYSKFCGCRVFEEGAGCGIVCNGYPGCPRLP